MDSTRKGPFYLISVNTAPERAMLLIGRMVERLRDRYEIVHVANCCTIEEVAPVVRQLQPNILFSASMWTPLEAMKVRESAQRERPGIRTHAIPQGLQVEQGPDAFVQHLLEVVPKLLDSVEL